MGFSGLATGREMQVPRRLAQRLLSRPMEIQIFGLKKSPDTRKALRFFAERRVKVHFVDLAERAASIGELRRFAQKFGVEALLDRAGRRFADLGLGASRFSEDRWLEKLVDEPGLLRIPLVRYQHQLTIGVAEDVWKQWVGR
jgi:arsenate reductase-like glutaredoxin family protein